jgi:uncharacterized membrane protein
VRKERLELFSDGVFAIVLTLLVLDLKVPGSLGLAGLWAAMPGLLVHAGAFFVIGMAWMTHHQIFEHMERITTPVLGWNLLILFWITLIPYGARIAAEHPDDGLGAAIMCFSMTFSTVSFLLLGRGGFTSVVLDPVMARVRRRRLRLFQLYVVIGLAATGCSFVSPYVGFAFLTRGASVLFVRPVREVHARLTTAQRVSEGGAGHAG